MKPDSRFRSSTTRLAIAYGTVVLLLVIALQGTVFLLTRQALRSEIQHVVEAELNELAEYHDSGGVNWLIAVLRARDEGLGGATAVYLLVDGSMKVLAGNLPAWPGELQPRDGSEVQFNVNAKNPGSSAHPVLARMKHLSGNHWLMVGTEISQSERSLRRFLLATVWGVASITALIGVLGWWYSRHTARRVSAISAACDSIVHSDLSRRLETGRHSDEFEQLSNTINSMLGRLEQQSAVLRATFGSIAHDLRTPLYRLRVRLEQGLVRADTSRDTRELVAPALQELDRVQRTLGTLLDIARAESGDATRAQEDVDLAALAREMHELYLPGMQERGLQLRLDLTGVAPVTGQRQLLAQLLANLLENALKYVPAGGDVLLATRVDGARANLIVADNGPGIAAMDRERAQQPFVRLQENSGTPQGSGLGLSLVRAIVRLHRGEVELQDNQPGLRVVCSFPLREVGRALR